MIPAILHQTWKSPRIPRRLRRFVRTWHRSQPWDYRFYTDAQLRAVIAANFPQFLQLYDRFEHPLERVDFARYALLYLHGGVYADLDMQCLRSLEPLMDTDHVILGREPDEHLHIYRFEQILCNALLMSPARHSFWLELMDYISEKYQHGGNVVYNTGPMAITQMHRDRPNAFDRVQIAPPNWFYPLIDSRFGGKTQGRFRHVSWNCNVHEAFAAHHWLHTNDTLWNRFKTMITTTVQGRRQHFCDPAAGYDSQFFRERLSDDRLRSVQIATLEECINSLRIHHVDTWLIGSSLDAWQTNQAMECLELGVYYNDLYCLRSLKWEDSEYLLDINPNHIARRPQVRNQVDARFVDKRTGVYVDLYGFHPTENRQVLSDKRNRTVHVNELFPLVPCRFAGVEVLRPRGAGGDLGLETNRNFAKNENAAQEVPCGSP